VADWCCPCVRFAKKGGSEVNVDSEPQRCGWYSCPCVGVVNGGVVIHSVVAGVGRAFVLQKKRGSEVNVDSELQRCGWCCWCVGGVLFGGVVVVAVGVVGVGFV